MAYHVTIKTGNLLDAPASDFIVNPSNTVLQLGSGVSGAFARACGPALQSAMTRALKETGTLQKGDVVATGGCARFGSMLHAAVMDYNPGAAEALPRLGEIETILRNIQTALAAFAALHGKNVTLALPLMGTGVGGLDKRQVLEIYRDFFRSGVGFECEVLLYAHSEGDGALMRSVFGEELA
ncbi:macro domain-containing protein [Sulfurimonas sp. HSL-3221]|uniref:macro domain-containing protein n=1 Tax=Sulfurimonadaceae TaxID=2771471 RepID=UPI001E625EA0|nr:macro domain-containing protein [Sulfurimonas sp. HSL-3221]UFS63564.1 macro domain-containing protein [Sulfurimonas sp. HSL-3221]